MALALIALALAGYAALIGAWRWLVRRWRLVGPGAPRREELGRHEYLARRSLRTLLAFDFLVVFPFGLLAVAGFAVGALTGEGLPAEALFPVLGLAMFALAIPGLRRSVAHLEARRRAGLPEQTDAEAMAEARSTGHVGLDALLRARAPGASAAAAAIGVGSIAAWLVPDGWLLERLAKENDAIRSGELWRLVTVAFAHANLVHLAFNVMILADVGATLERLVGTRRMLVVLVAGTACGTAASAVLVPERSVGASGGVLALAAALVAFGVRHRAALPGGMRARYVRAAVELVALNAALTFLLPGIDWAAHASGMVTGAALGWLSAPTPAVEAALAAAPEPAATAEPGAAAGQR